MHLRLAEISTFFSLGNDLQRSTSALSGGEKQLVHLASALMLSPKILVLDEPTAQLDPIAKENFLAVLLRVHRELGITIVMSEHSLDELFPLASKVVGLQQGKVVYKGTPNEWLAAYKTLPLSTRKLLPSAVQVYCEVADDHQDAVLGIASARKWLEECYASANIKSITETNESKEKHILLEAKHLSFRYEKKDKDILNDCSVNIQLGEMTALMGANASGKSTLLKVLSGVLKPYHGKVKMAAETSQKKLKISTVPQQVKTLFVEECLIDDFYLVASQFFKKEEAEIKINELSKMLGIEKILQQHPYDISEGERQKAAILLALLTSPQVLFLDEPTKGIDLQSKHDLGQLLLSLKKQGMTIVLATHDMDFCAQFADNVLFLFDGKIVTQTKVRKFLVTNQFYTTAARRMSLSVFENAITLQEVIYLCKENKKTSL